MPAVSRRSLLAGAGVAAAAYAASPIIALAAQSPFKIAVITDEISQDFDHACSVASKEFGLQWVELRGMWKKSLHDLSDAEIADALMILNKYSLRVTDIASPLFKADWPGAPPTRHASAIHSTTPAETFKQQDAVLARSIALAKQFNTDKIRCFDFWRLDDVAPYRSAINTKLHEAAETCGKQGILLVLENEFECNTATARESVATLAGVPSPNLALNWDAGNAVMRGELDAFPTGWDLLPKQRIRHCHVKNAVKAIDGKIAWSPVGTGFIDWAAQFKALKQSGYRDAVSLETHWHGAATPEESSRISWAGMKQALQDSATL